MAKRGTKVLQARKSAGTGDEDDSLLMRSAESLGRVIGSLQRQVKGTRKRVSSMAEDAMDALPELPSMDDVWSAAPSLRGRKASPRRKTSKSRTTASRKSSGTKKSARKRAASRKTTGTRKMTGAAKTARARKRAAGRKR